eukprot:5463-Heterococcus_DN1.PRE.1
MSSAGVNYRQRSASLSCVCLNSSMQVAVPLYCTTRFTEAHTASSLSICSRLCCVYTTNSLLSSVMALLTACVVVVGMIGTT